MSTHAWLAALSAWVWPRLANHLWEGVLLALVVSAAALALRRAPARARHRLWLLLALKLALPSFVLSGTLALLPADPVPAVEAVGQWVTVAPVPVRALPVPSPGAHPESLCVATLSWAAGCVVLAGLRVRRRLALARVLARARPLTDGPAHEALARLRRSSRETPEVRLVSSQDATHLGIAGIVRPVLLVPDALARVLEPAEMEAILEHELAHIRRRDVLVDALQAGLACALWFFPVVWLLGRRLAVEGERACDEEVLKRAGSPQVYLLALLKACRTALAAPVPGMVTATTALRERIAGLLRPAPSHSVGQHAAWVLVVIACVTASAAGMDLDQWRRVEIDPSDGPVRLTAARARIVTTGDEEIVHPPEVHLENRTDRAVVGIRLGFGAAPAWHDVVDLPVSLPAQGAAILEPDWQTWHNTQPAGSKAPLRARIEGVIFEGDVAPREEPAGAAGGPVLPARFANLEGAPLIVTEARSWKVPGQETQVEVRLRNASSRSIALVKLRFKSDHPGHGVTAQPVQLPPQGTLVLRSSPIVPGAPEQMSVQVVGVGFEDGGEWGLLDSTIHSRDLHVPLPEETR